MLRRHRRHVDGALFRLVREEGELRIRDPPATVCNVHYGAPGEYDN